jgi:REP element-mobilizing transposase RayT
MSQQANFCPTLPSAIGLASESVTAVTAPDVLCGQYLSHDDEAAKYEPRRRSREAAEECSPRRKPWVYCDEGRAPTGRKTLAHTSANILLHLIFSTQGRLALIKPEFRDDLFAYLGGIIREMRGTALIINGAADHVHVLVRIRPTHSAAEIARVIKANSSAWVRAKWSSNFAWQTGYGAFSVSESNVAAVTKYIASQEEHHKKHSFQEELLAFLKKNNVAYDVKYLWS